VIFAVLKLSRGPYLRVLAVGFLLEFSLFSLTVTTDTSFELLSSVIWSPERATIKRNVFCLNSDFRSRRLRVIADYESDQNRSQVEFTVR
jgi:hypothetical protein